MTPYTEFARQMSNGIRLSNLFLAQSRLSLLQIRLLLKEGVHAQAILKSPAKRARAKRKRR
ncbi:MAG TPA: hypothetical protein VK641_10595 [Terriglobales bacterium]|nr:hypothetical protein [Terriglobales bacterium]